MALLAFLEVAAGLVVDPRTEAREEILTSRGPPGVIEPTILHVVQPLGKVRFYVEFFRSPAAAAAAS